MKNICLNIEYIGTNYYGYQKQKKGNTIESELKKAILIGLNEDPQLFASGRTDAGVHAICQTVNFKSNCTVPANKIAIVLNSHLPNDIKIIKSFEVEQGFNARFSCKDKTYLYKVCTHEHMSVFLYDRVLHYPYTINFDILQKATQDLIGEHDFYAFMSSKSNIKENTVRTINFVNIIKTDYGFDIEINGNGFLYNMVRIITGTLLEMAREKLPQDSIKSMIHKKDRSLGGKTVLPSGLYLKQVNY